MKRPPCTPDCPHRCIEPNCHTHCSKYLEWRALKDKENCKRQEINFDIGYMVTAQERMRKVRKRG